MQQAAFVTNFLCFAEYFSTNLQKYLPGDNKLLGKYISYELSDTGLLASRND